MANSHTAVLGLWGHRGKTVLVRRMVQNSPAWSCFPSMHLSTLQLSWTAVTRHTAAIPPDVLRELSHPRTLLTAIAQEAFSPKLSFVSMRYRLRQHCCHRTGRTSTHSDETVLTLPRTHVSYAACCTLTHNQFDSLMSTRGRC